MFDSSMTPITTIPSEVLVAILQQCDNFQDTISLVSTCKHLRSIWESEFQKAIIWSVGCRSIAAFDVALLAVRATNLVQISHQREVIAPVMTISTMTCLVRRPDLDELKRVLDMQQLARCIRHIFLLPQNLKVDFSIDGPNWHENFDLAIYRVLFAGAFLAHAYLAPFFDNSGTLDRNFLHGFYEERKKAQQSANFGIPNDDVFWDREVDHIRTFPVYELEEFNNMEATFNPFWIWFLDDCRSKRSQAVGGNHDHFHHTDDISNSDWLISEIARMVFIHGQLCDNFGNKRFFANADSLRGYSRYSEQITDRKIAEKTRPHKVVILGNFRLEEILVPDLTEDMDFDLLLVNQVPSQNPLPDISMFLEYFHAYSGAPNQRNGSPSPRPPLQFFEFILRKEFHMRFADTAFTWTTKTYHKFLQEGRIFDDQSPVPTAILQAEYPLPRLGFDPDW